MPTPNGVGRTPNVVTRRRGLPSGRAVVGGFLIALAALGVFVAYQGAARHATTQYAVVAHDVAPGSILTAADLETAGMELPNELAGRAFTDPSALVGKVTLGPLTDGELVQRSAVVAPAQAGSAYQVSLPIDRSRALAGGLVAGEVVDVLVTYASETIVVSRGATVVRSDSGGRGTIGSGGETVLVLAVRSPDEVLAITHGSQVGKVTVVRTTGVADEDVGPNSYQPPTPDAGAGAAGRSDG